MRLHPCTTSACPVHPWCHPLQIVPRLGYSVHGVAHLVALTTLTALATATYLQCVFCNPGKHTPACLLQPPAKRPRKSMQHGGHPQSGAASSALPAVLLSAHRHRTVPPSCRPRACWLAARCRAARRDGAAGQASRWRTAVRLPPLHDAPSWRQLARRLRPLRPSQAVGGPRARTYTRIYARGMLPARPCLCRYCKKCAAYKPPRTHHCRRCGACILRMDHHW